MAGPFVAFGLVLAACGGDTVDLGYDDARVRGRAESPIDVAAARARCAAHATESLPAESFDALTAQLTGRWLACDDDPEGVPPRAFEIDAAQTIVPLTLVDARLSYVEGAARGAVSVQKVLSCCSPPTWWVTLGPHGAFFLEVERGPLRFTLRDRTGGGDAPRPLRRRYVAI